MIFFDRSHHDIVAGCRQCGRREIFTSQDDADTWVADHIHRAHPGPTNDELRAINAHYKRQERRRARDTP